jgi:hypothetical protein
LPAGSIEQTERRWAGREPTAARHPCPPRILPTSPWTGAAQAGNSAGSREIAAPPGGTVLAPLR